MNANARKWIRALRSGKYQQTTGALRTNEGYCCLGVACELALKDAKLELVSDTIEGADGAQTFRYKGRARDWSDAVLPIDVQEWLGLESCDGRFVNDEGTWPDETLAGVNDDGKSFEQIAELIESEPEGLFKTPVHGG